MFFFFCKGEWKYSENLNLKTLYGKISRFEGIEVKNIENDINLSIKSAYDRDYWVYLNVFGTILSAKKFVLKVIDEIM